jgi:uncharacterized protein (TIGR02452 family)
MDKIKFYDDNWIKADKLVELCLSEIEVNSRNTLEQAEVLAGQNKKPCCLNFASHKRPGGGYLGTADAQEEYLFRRTNLPELLDNDEVKKNYYPLTGTKALYCPNVVCSKGKDLEQINPFELSVITCAAVVNPKLSDYYNLVEEKIVRILDIAVENEEKYLVLGAWGCGVFRNEPSIIASIFSFYLLHREYHKDSFEEVYFSIPAGHNYNVFSRHFEILENGEE